MAEITSADLVRLVAQNLESASPGVLSAMVKTFAEALKGAEADAMCGASYGLASAKRTDTRNGYRARRLDIRAGTVDLAVPRLRHGASGETGRRRLLIGQLNNIERWLALGRPGPATSPLGGGDKRREVPAVVYEMT
jgi:hypothetical protein